MSSLQCILGLCFKTMLGVSVWLLCLGSLLGVSAWGLFIGSLLCISAFRSLLRVSVLGLSFGSTSTLILSFVGPLLCRVSPLGLTKDIQIVLRLFLVMAMYCQASSSQFYQSLNLSGCQLAGKEAQVHAVGSNSIETTYILFELPQGSRSGLSFGCLFLTYALGC